MRVPVPAHCSALLAVAALVACGGGGYRAAMQDYARTADPKKIVVYVTTGPCDSLKRTETKETDAAVTVQVWVRQAPADKPCQSIAEQEMAVDVRLNKPLGTRTVHGAPGAPAVV